MDSHSFWGISVGGLGKDCCLIVDSFEKNLSLTKRPCGLVLSINPVFRVRGSCLWENFHVLIILKTLK